MCEHCCDVRWRRAPEGSGYLAGADHVRTSRRNPAVLLRLQTLDRQENRVTRGRAGRQAGPEGVDRARPRGRLDVATSHPRQ